MIQKITFLNLIPDLELQAKLDFAYVRVMKSGIYLNGIEAELFHREWADYCNRKYCILTASGLDALKLVLRAWDISKNDKVLVPEWGCVQTWLVVQQLGAIPMPWNVNIKVAIIVHLYGSLSQDKLLSTAELKILDGVKFLEDACQAHGLKGVSDPAVYSFYPTKNLGAFGDGGAIVTDDTELYAELSNLVPHSSMRMDELQCAFLRTKLPFLDYWNEIRTNHAMQYLTGLKNVTLPTNLNSVWHQFVIQYPERDRLALELSKRGIETMVHYYSPPHRQLDYDYDLPEADRMANEVLSLPIAPHLNENDIKYVIEVINEIT